MFQICPWSQPAGSLSVVILLNSYRITGRLRSEQNVLAEGYVVQAFDKDRGIYFHPDDRLGKAKTTEDGSFEMTFNEATFKDWFESEPNVYLQVRDGDGRIVISTQSRKNTTGRIDFQIKLGKPPTDPLEPDIYAHSLDRMRAGLQNVGDAVDLSRDDVRSIFELMAGALAAWTSYRDELVRVCGYDGIQVPEQPRREDHRHVTRWDEAVLPV
jgi:hypothetical protein